MFKANDKNLKVLTPDGYKNFKGIQKINKPSSEVVFDSGRKLIFSNTHLICVDIPNCIFKRVEELQTGDIVLSEDGVDVVSDRSDIGHSELYDIIEVEGINSYYTGGILSHNCTFINTGTSSLNETLYKNLLKEVREPVEILMDGKYKIWELPSPDRLYVGGVDVSEGVGSDYSVIEILDMTDLNEIIQVAEYHDNTIPVAEFSNKLYEILQHWGNPLVCIERNNQGGQVADRLGMDYGYPKIVNWGSKLAGRKSMELFGMISSRNTKYYACANARYYYSDKGAVVFRNDASLEEIFKDFVKLPNDTWGAISGKHDDRTMATIWALMILDKDLCERWFTIEEFDTCGKPSKISPLDFGIQYFERATSIYTNEQVSRIEQSRIAPMVFGSMGEMDCEISQLKADGWQLLGGSMPYIDPSRTFSDSQWESYERLF
jgi:hypothetical protein